MKAHVDRPILVGTRFGDVCRVGVSTASFRGNDVTPYTVV
jgi:hypothetical protein